MAVLSLFGVLLFLAGSAVSSEVTTEDDRNKQQLAEKGLLYTKLFEEGDFKGLAENIYTPDCVLMPPDGPAIHGSELIKYFTNYDVRRFVGEGGEVHLAGNMAVSRDEYAGYHDDGSVAMRGNTLTVWQKIDGKWYIKFNMWTKNV